MICQKCGRVVRPQNTVGRNEPITVRRYYCSCGYVNKSLEQVAVTWKKTDYKKRKPEQQPAEQKPKRQRKRKSK